MGSSSHDNHTSRARRKEAWHPIREERSTAQVRRTCSAALRPYFQEGYLAGTTDVTTDFDSKTELDFRNRLIAKFEIPRARTFWGRGFNQIPETALYPKGDKILDLCNELKSQLRDELRLGEVGEFIRVWSTLEEYLLQTARRLTERNVSL